MANQNSISWQGIFISVSPCSGNAYRRSASVLNKYDWSISARDVRCAFEYQCWRGSSRRFQTDQHMETKAIGWSIVEQISRVGWRHRKRTYPRRVMKMNERRMQRPLLPRRLVWLENAHGVENGAMMAGSVAFPTASLIKDKRPLVFEVFVFPNETSLSNWISNVGKLVHINELFLTMK